MDYALEEKRGSLMPRDIDSYGNREWFVSTPPTVEPVSVAEVKAFGHIEGDDEDVLIQGFISAIRQAAEEYMGRALIEQSLTMFMDFWPPSGILYFPRPPLVSVTSVSTLDEDDVATVYPLSNYYTIRSLGNDMSSSRLIIRQGCTLPTNTSRDYAGFKVIWKAGYGAKATDVPDLIREGIKIWTIFLYEGRGSSLSDSPGEGVDRGSIWPAPRKVSVLLDVYKVPKI